MKELTLGDCLLVLKKGIACYMVWWRKDIGWTLLPDAPLTRLHLSLSFEGVCRGTVNLIRTPPIFHSENLGPACILARENSRPTSLPARVGQERRWRVVYAGYFYIWMTLLQFVIVTLDSVINICLSVMEAGSPVIMLCVKVMSNGRRGWIKVLFRMFLCDIVRFWAFLTDSGIVAAFCNG